MSRARPKTITLVPWEVDGLNLVTRRETRKVEVPLSLVEWMGVDPHGGPVVLEWVQTKPEGRSIQVGWSYREWEAWWKPTDGLGLWKMRICNQWRRVLPRHWVEEGGWVRVAAQRHAWKGRERAGKGRGLG